MSAQVVMTASGRPLFLSFSKKDSTLADLPTIVTEFAMLPAIGLSPTTLVRLSNTTSTLRLIDMAEKRLSIMGIRGIPAQHGGFETFAERLALYLTKRGWSVTVYCQGQHSDADVAEDSWCGIRRIFVPVQRDGAMGTVEFDWKSVRIAAKRDTGLVLTLGYNTAIFCSYLRWRGIRNLINMDGLEWRRTKWRWYERTWLYMNERIGCWTGNHLIADHPSIAVHLATRVNQRKITMIPYGADRIDEYCGLVPKELGLGDSPYALVIARPEPENSIVEIVTAFSRRPRGAKLVVLGKYDPVGNPYHREVVDAAGPEVIFPGAIYDQNTVQALRRHALFYVHGHQVGGTNPSLVEALGASSAVIAHENEFNRWVAGPDARFFSNESDCDLNISALLADHATVRAMREASGRRFDSAFRWDSVLAQYEALLERNLRDEKKPKVSPAHGPAEPAPVGAVLESVATTAGALEATGMLAPAATIEAEGIFAEHEITSHQ
jgi:glycosyltransferase involved in cell wall biosynthesis